MVLITGEVELLVGVVAEDVGEVMVDKVALVE